MAAKTVAHLLQGQRDSLRSTSSPQSTQRMRVRVRRGLDLHEDPQEYLPRAMPVRRTVTEHRMGSAPGLQRERLAAVGSQQHASLAPIHAIDI